MLPLFLARKIYGSDDKNQKVSKPAIRIATLGVAIGLAVMIITVGVVYGFKHSIRDKAIGFGSHIQVENFMSMQSGDPYPICMDDSLINVLKNINGINHVGRYTLTQGILKTDSDFLGIVFKGIGEEYDTQFLAQNIIEGEMPRFSAKKSSNKILVSKTIADKLHLKTGDRLFAYFVCTDDVRVRRFTVSGIYETNMSHFDQVICIADLYTTNKLNGWEPKQCSGAEIEVSDFTRLEQVAQEMVEKVNRTTDHNGETISTQTIFEAYPQIFTWLDLLDINVWIILALMTCVAGFTMISGLLIIILERTQMIGILKALGARNSTVRHTFLWFATFIITRGLLLGNIIGIGLLLLQKYTGVVTLDPKTYYVSEVPVEINIPIFLAINAATLAISVMVLVAPSYLVAHIQPSKSMRYE
ncbi:MAG: ABC transporter permease [Prevotella sp.]|nr:ABC transporter permease [Prevotella sp.]MBO5205328.1 ABC transporter permease [Prevotella sp.]